MKDNFEELIKERKANKEKAKISQDSLIANFDNKADELYQDGAELIKKLREIEISS